MTTGPGPRPRSDRTSPHPPAANTDLNSRLSEFRVDDSSDATTDRATERVLLEVPQPGTHHRGGMLQFGPDGYRYIGPGDGGI